MGSGQREEWRRLAALVSDDLQDEEELIDSDVGLLAGRVQTLFQQREPVLYEAGAYASLHQWLHNKSGEE